MSIPALMLCLPLVASVVAHVFRRWVLVQSFVGSISCFLLVVITLQAPIEQMVVLAGRDVLLSASWMWLGRSFTFGPEDRQVLVFIFSFALMFFVGAAGARVSRNFMPLGLAVLSLLVATLLVRPLLYAAVFLEIMAALSAFMLSDDEHRNMRGSLRLLIFISLGVPLILLAGWRLETYQANPDSTGLLELATILLGTGFIVMLAVVPFHSWLPTIAEEASPYSTAFICSFVQGGVFLLFLDVFVQYEWFRENPVVPAGLRIAGLAMVVFGGVFAIVQRNQGRLMGYTVLVDSGAALLALALGTPDAVRIAISILGLRILGLAVWGLGLGIMELKGDLDDLRGLVRVYPVATAAMLVGGFSVAGLPLMAGFTGRWALLLSLAGPDTVSAILLLLASVCVCLGYMKVIAELVYQPVSGRSQWSLGESSAAIILSATGVLAVFAVGTFPQLLLPALTRTVDAFVLLTQ